MRRMIAAVLLLAMVCPVFAAGEQVGDIINIKTIEQGERIERAEPILESAIDPDTYLVGPNDQLTLRISVEKIDLEAVHNLIVGADGKIYLPNFGELFISDLSIAQAKKKIDQAIRNNYASGFTSSLLLKQPKKVKIYLTGMVQNPGPQVVYDNSRISEVISLAGGNVSGGSTRYFYIHRRAADGQTKVLRADIYDAFRNRDISKDLRVQAGDVIEVPDAANERISILPTTEVNDKLLFEGKETFVYVYGEVARGGRYEFVPGRKISDYISYAGGPSRRAWLSGATLTRKENGSSRQYGVNVADVIYKGDTKHDMEVRGGDVINVPGNFFYFDDFASFVNTILLGLTLYNTVK